MLYYSQLHHKPKNYHEVSKGEEFDFEMITRAECEDGGTYQVSWIFSAIKGEDFEYDNFDYSVIHDVNLIG